MITTKVLPGVIGTGLSKNNTLKVLRLYSCALSCPAVEAIATVLTKSSNLHILRLEQCIVSEALHANATLNNIDTNGIDVTEFDTVNRDQIKKGKTSLHAIHKH